MCIYVSFYIVDIDLPLNRAINDKGKQNLNIFQYKQEYMLLSANKPHAELTVYKILELGENAIFENSCMQKCNLQKHYLIEKGCCSQ